MAFSDSFLQDLCQRNDIEEVVASYVRLTKRTGANLFGLCPFHSEKTPSFSVNPDKQIYHCFGCGKGGSVISFIMEIENLSFADAVRFLANKAGMPIPDEGPDEGRSLRARLLELNKAAARWFYERLTGPGGERARTFAANRGLSAAIVKKFGVGFAPDGWNNLEKAMLDKGYSHAELVQAGLIKRNSKGTGYYDAFRDRLVFPIIDVRGSVIGFSGRIIGDGEPKYLNSPETPVFSKSHNLFGLFLAKKSKCGYIILSEGNIDVVSLHQAGFDSAVASLGTSLTPEQARLISRYANEVVIAYDNDEAGQKAARRAIGILEKLDLKVRVLKLEGAKDPDDFIKLKGADAFRDLLEKSESHIDFRLASLKNRHDLSTDDGKVSFLKDAVGLLSELHTGLERQVYALRVAELTGVSDAVVLSEAERLRKRRLQKAKKQYEDQTLRPARSLQPAERGVRYENIRSAAAEEGLIRLLYLEPSLAKAPELPEPELFSSPLLGRLYAELLARARNGQETSMALLGQAFTAAEQSHLSAIVQKPELLQNAEKALSDYIEIIRSERQMAVSQDDLRAIAEKYRQRKGYGG